MLSKDNDCNGCQVSHLYISIFAVTIYIHLVCVLLSHSFFFSQNLFFCLIAFQQESNHLRQLVNLLAERRLKLSIEVNRMEREVRRMKHVEDRFHHVVQREGKNVAQFRTLVRENAQTMEEIKVRMILCVLPVLPKLHTRGHGWGVVWYGYTPFS